MSIGVHGADADALEQGHPRVVLGGERVLRARRSPARFPRAPAGPLAGWRAPCCLRAVAASSRLRAESSAARSAATLPRTAVNAWKSRVTVEDDLLVLRVEAGVGLHDERVRRVHGGSSPAEIEQQPLQAEHGDDEVRVGA